MTRNYYRLNEYSTRANLAFAEEDVRQLAGQFANQIEITPSLDRPGHYQLRALHYVGTIALAHTTIIIEPKTPIANLAHMLATVYQLARWQPATSPLSATGVLLELVGTAFLGSVMELIGQGLNHGYQDVTENIPLVRGQIDFAGQMLENLGQPTRHRCTYADLSANILENQILKLALMRLESFELPEQLSWQQARVTTGLAAVNLPSQAISARDFDKLTFTRLNEHYRLPLAFARLIIDVTSPDWREPEQQQCHWPACLVDMNRMFERYNAHRLQLITNSPQINQSITRTFLARPITAPSAAAIPSPSPSTNPASEGSDVPAEESPSTKIYGISDIFQISAGSARLAESARLARLARAIKSIETGDSETLTASVDKVSADNADVALATLISSTPSDSVALSANQSLAEQGDDEKPIVEKKTTKKRISKKKLAEQQALEALTVRYQTSVHLDQAAKHSLRPDLVISLGERVLMVLDTKYKLAYEATDYYQMISYCIVLAVDYAVLVYPAWKTRSKRTIIKVKNSDIQIEIAPIELAGSIEQMDRSIDRLLRHLGVG